MDLLVIAPTHSYKRQGMRLEVDDTIKDSPNANRCKQKLGKLIPLNANKAPKNVGQKVYNDMRPMNHLLERCRSRDLEIFYQDELLSYHPMHGISLPEMKLRQKDLSGY